MRRVGVGPVDHHVLDVEYDGPARLFARLVKIAGHFCLAVDDHRRAGVFLEINAKHLVAIRDQGAIVAEPFGVEPVRATGLF